MLVFLIGPSSVGKSTVSKIVVERFPALRLIDLDAAVANLENKQNAFQVVQEYGWEHFFQRCKQIVTLANLEHEARLTLVDVGEGILWYPSGQEWVQKFKTISLVASAEQVFARRHSHSGLPFDAFYNYNYSEQRQQFYKQTNHLIDCTAYSVDETARRLLDYLIPLHLIYLNLGIEVTYQGPQEVIPRPGTGTPLFTVYRHTHGEERFYFQGLPADLRQELSALSCTTVFDAAERVLNILYPWFPETKIFLGETYYFVKSHEASEYPVVIEVDNGYAIFEEDCLACWAWTPNESENAAELAVETYPDFRRKGYARQAASTWAAAKLREGKIPFYSHKLSNQASAALARSLGVVHYARVISFSQPFRSN